MSEKFQPPPSNLPPLADLMDIADVSEEDVQNAVDKWVESPPDDEFKLLIVASVDE